MQLTTHGNDPYLSVMTENKEYNKRSDEALRVLSERGLRLRRTPAAPKKNATSCRIFR